MSCVKRVLLIGLGSIGKRHLRVIKKLRPEIEVLVLRSGKGNACKEELLAAKILWSVEEAFQYDLDAVIICGPATTHLESVKIFNAKGIPIFVEKPLCISMEEVSSFSLNQNSLVYVGYILRHDPLAQKFLDLLKVRAIGDVVHARVECGSFLPMWRKDVEYRESVSARADLGGGVVLELSHEIDYVNWLLGMPDTVYAVSPEKRVLDIEVEEMVEAILTTNKINVSMNLNFNSLEVKREMRVFGTEGMIKWNIVNRSLSVLSQHGVNQDFHSPTTIDELYEIQMSHFLACIEGKYSPYVDFGDGLKALRVIDAIKRSLKSRSREEV